MNRTWSFRATWTVAAPRAEVFEVLVDLQRYPEWWPQVRAVAKVSDDRARVLCRSALPYELDLVLEAVHREEDLLETTVSGDLAGVVRWRLTPVAGGTRMDFEQDVVVTGRLRPVLAAAAAPVVRWNHDRMMAGCIAGLLTRVQGSWRTAEPPGR